MNPDFPSEPLELLLREMLARLYDPAYQAPAELFATLRCAPQAGMAGLRAALIQAIEALKPGPDVPTSARSWRVYDLLRQRYILNLTQEEVAGKMMLSVRHLRREQQDAVAILAVAILAAAIQASTIQTGSNLPGGGLGDRSQVQQPAREPAESRDGSETSLSAESPPDVRTQAREEMSALEQSTPGSIAGLQGVLEGAISTLAALASARGVSFNVQPVAEDLAAEIHPVVLRQVVTGILNHLLGAAEPGEIHIQAQASSGARILIRFSGNGASSPLQLNDFSREALTSAQGVVRQAEKNGPAAVEMEIPAARMVKVLVIDDNESLAYLYQRYAAGTRFQIYHRAEGQGVFAVVEAEKPDIIMLDVMLADSDGWEILSGLHERPTTRAIPVVVCSVIQEAELALALGAADYLQKPVKRMPFLHCLERVWQSL